MEIALCHHLSLGYYGGGEKYLISLAKELSKEHDVSIFALPILLDGKRKVEPESLLDGIPYKETKRATIKADVAYVTYNPLSWLYFHIKGKKIGAIHSEAYWKTPHPRYGFYPLLATIVNRFTSYSELRMFDAIHVLNNVYPINHPKIYTIPNFVDSVFFAPRAKKSDEFTVAYASRKVWQKGWQVAKNLKWYSGMNIKISENLEESDMPDFFSSSHATIVPSLVDTFGLTIVESALCGTPVVTTSLPCHKRLGLPLIYADDYSQYMKALNELKEMWEFKQRNYEMISKNFREFALRYDKKEVMTKLNNMFEEVCKND